MCTKQDWFLPLIDKREKVVDSSTTRSLYNLPPGCRFYPSENVLLNHYLVGKNSSVTADSVDISSHDLIKELNLYDYEPFNFPDSTRFVHGYRERKRHWFCYTKSKGNGKRKRRTKGGFWKRIGKVKDVFDGGKIVLGTKTKFVFYLVNSVKKAVRTPWIMFEYSLLPRLKAPFVLCRVFVKPCAGKSVLENTLSCCLEETVSAFRHTSIQHDRFLRPGILEAEINGDEFAKGLADPIVTRPVSVPSLEFASGIPPDLPNDQAVSPLTIDELLAIVEEDYIELDDLV